MQKLLWLSLLLLVCNSGKADEAVFYKSPGRLYLPNVKIEDKVYANVWLTMKSDKSFSLLAYQPLSESESPVYQKIQDTDCRPADVFNKLAAYKAYLDGDTSLCLIHSRFSTIEGALVSSYVLIENSTLQFVTDGSRDSFGVCCFYINNDYSNLEYGYLENGLFIPLSLFDTLDFERQYVLRLSGESVMTVEF